MRSLIVAVAGLIVTASHAAAQPFCNPVEVDYDPMTTTQVVGSYDLWKGPFLLQSPESPDSQLVYHVGTPGGDGCVAGILSGSNEPVGVLDLVDVAVSCIHFMIESAAMPAIELYRWDGTLREAFTPATSHVMIFDWPSEIRRIRIRPGIEGGVRAALCIDDVGFVHPGLPARRSSWGSVKAVYR